jgi:NADH-quinone oxidoreductase subunit G/[NiFe] hydrogenase diaphorase moiety small subunit/NADP-reducing hydrogenase subunit HndD
MNSKINININGIAMEVEKGTTILEAADRAGIIIPTLCYHKDLCIAGNCRVCVVELIGQKRLSAACATPCEEGMEIRTNSLHVRNSRKHIIELLLSEHRAECTSCYKNGNCELQKLASDYKIMTQDFIPLAHQKKYTIDQFSPSILKDDSKCIRCQRCVRTCAELQGVNALSVAYKGDQMKITTFFEKAITEVVCTNCGQCINHCPTGALVERNYIEEVWGALSDPNLHVVVQTAPAVRVGLGEEMGLPPGERVTGKMVEALKRLGFNSVLDTDFTADLTIIEEGMTKRLNFPWQHPVPQAGLNTLSTCIPGVWSTFQPVNRRNKCLGHLQKPIMPKTEKYSQTKLFLFPLCHVRLKSLKLQDPKCMIAVIPTLTMF